VDPKLAAWLLSLLAFRSGGVLLLHSCAHGSIVGSLT
jgi:hypothetical protein